MGNYCCCEEDRKEASKISYTSVSEFQAGRLRKAAKQYPQRRRSRSRDDSDNQRGLVAKHGPENYQSIKYLGRGAFGDVVLAEEKETGKTYAMKIIDKANIQEFNVLQSQLVEQISNKNILVPIVETFQNENKIYIIMDYFERGDLYFYMKKKTLRFTEDIIRDLLSEIIYGLQVLHSHQIIYRELKPQNILVSSDGHIRLADYCFSKMLQNNKKNLLTYVGPAQYMAPEAYKKNYGKKVDLWSLGVLIFQILFDQNPFGFDFQENNIETVLNQKIGKMSQELRELLIGLLEKDPNKRLSLQESMNMSFFKSVDWQAVKERRNNPPLKDFIEKNDHIKFRDPTNDVAHRRNVQNKKTDYKTKLHEFRSSMSFG